ncbi:MAG: tRNA1(Val) (adenine(37)-N6)-methyltransferase [Lachnospiraceae bacterium]|nr:tRNA1(Val) (adenine(37)-N6)-methyltransferase [Lachnospiraceae bacterium]
MCDLKPGERIDDLQRNGLRIIQNPERFCFGMDSVLLSHFVSEGKNTGSRILDLGTGNGIIPLLLSALMPGYEIKGLEIQEESVDQARRSVEMNGLSHRIEIVNGNIKDASNIFGASSFDIVTVNPPYMIGGHGLKNPKDAKTIARHEILCTWEDIVGETKKLLPSKGKMYVVHRPFRLAEIISSLTAAGLEPKRMRLVYPAIDKEPNMVLIEAVRGGRSRITVEKPLIIYGEDGEYTKEVYELYGF